MARVTEIKKSGSIYRVTLEDTDSRATLLLSEGDIAEYGIRKGGEISPENSDKLREMSTYREARACALTTLAHTDHTRISLLRRLLSRGYPEDVSISIVGEMVDFGYIDEDRQLMRLVTSLYERLYGRAYIRAKLTFKGYRGEDVDAIVDLLTSIGEIDFDESFRRLCEKRGATTDEDVERLRYKYGFRDEFQ